MGLIRTRIMTRIRMMILRPCLYGGGEKFRLENFWQFAEIMGIRREYSLRVLSGAAWGEASSYGARLIHVSYFMGDINSFRACWQ